MSLMRCKFHTNESVTAITLKQEKLHLHSKVILKEKLILTLR